MQNKAATMGTRPVASFTPADTHKGAVIFFGRRVPNLKNVGSKKIATPYFGKKKKK